ncbi:MAG: NAD(P)-dependent oxidoreductase [Lentisphaerota bacterium]
MNHSAPAPRILCVLGSDTPLGSSILEQGKAAGLACAGLSAHEIDLPNMRQVQQAIPEAHWVVNCLEFDDLEKAEEYRSAAFDLNSEGARNAAKVCATRNIFFIQISTDCIFDGKKNEPYTERDLPSPINVYGASKLAGEKAVRAEGGRSLIVRTQALFGQGQDNYILQMMRTMEREHGSIHVLRDTITCPTYTRHLGQAILRLCFLGKTGILHVSANGECSQYNLVRRLAARIYPRIEILEVTSQEAGLKARRPGYTVFSKRRYQTWTGHTMPPWHDGLYEYLKDIGFFSVQPLPPGTHH